MTISVGKDLIMKHHLELKDIEKLVKRRHLILLSKEYKNAHEPLKLKCPVCGNIWFPTQNNIRKGTGCPDCSKKRMAEKRRLTEEHIKELLKKRGWKLLSKYYGIHKKIIVGCKNNHIFEIYISKINEYACCPTCSPRLRSESMCRSWFENLFKEKFPKRRLRWLHGHKNSMRELDGYCEKLNLAFEFQGDQHKELVPWLQKTISLRQQKRRDKIKNKQCKKHDIILIHIPYEIEPEYMGEYIEKQCKKRGIKTKLKSNTLKFENIIPNSDNTNEMKIIAKDRNWKFLSKNYVNSHTKLKWQCSKGHKIFMTPNSIKSGNGCIKCSYIERGVNHRSNVDIRKIERERGIVCLSKYKGISFDHTWKCKKCKYMWDATPYSISKNHTGCPQCAGNLKDNIEHMHAIARSRGGKCLSSKYTNTHTKLKWQCVEGHIWKAGPVSIKAGSWCRRCSQKDRWKKSLNISNLK